MKKILVPCDFSMPSEEALQFAIAIATKTGGEVFVLHVIYTPILHDPIFGETPFSPEVLGTLEETSRKQFMKMKDKVADTTDRINFEVTYGEILAAINHFIESRKIDLVVMGTNGSSGVREIFIGSNTEKVVRHATVPVLTVRTAPELTSIKKILVPNTLELNQTEFIEKLKEVQEFFGASLHVLLINTIWQFRADYEARESLEEFARHYRLQNYLLHFRNYHNEETGILKFAHDEKMDMIAMATHGRKGLAHLFNGSITEDLINHIYGPVWTYHWKQTP